MPLSLVSKLVNSFDTQGKGLKFGTITSKKILKEKECFGLQWKIRFIPDTENDAGKVPSLQVLRHSASGGAENSEVTTVNCSVGIHRPFLLPARSGI